MRSRFLVVLLGAGLALAAGPVPTGTGEPAATPAAAPVPALAGGVLVKSGQKIAFLGDSITAFGMEPLGYVSLTIAGLKANGIEVTAIGAGVGGHKSNQMLDRLERDVLGKKPDWMTLSCGVNDVGHGERGVPLEQYKTNVTAIVDRAQAAGVKVIILTATIIGEDPGNANNQKLAAYNDFLRALAREKGCPLADLNADCQAAIRTAPKAHYVLTVDGVHMNAAGNQVMARGVLRTLGLDAPQVEKAAEAWLDIPNSVELKPALQGKVLLSLRQKQKLDAVAARHRMTTNQMVALLYGADLAGGPAPRTLEEIEAFLDRQDRKDPAAVLQEGFARRMEELKK